jgi:lysophospholipase L1-like esterase
MLTQKRDYCDQPFRVAVALGESTTAGGSATDKQLCWVNLLGKLICEAQLEPVRLINSGLGANVVSPASMAYNQSGRPSARERYEKHVIAHRPDLVLISYGLNDARAGSFLWQFLEDLKLIVLDVKEQTGAVIVLLSAYFMTAFDDYEPFHRATVASLEAYNSGIEALAAECDVLFADVFDAQALTPWMVDPDGVHANNLGHRVIANRVFEVLAQNCSGLSQKAVRLQKDFEPWRDESVLRDR